MKLTCLCWPENHPPSSSQQWSSPRSSPVLSQNTIGVVIHLTINVACLSVCVCAHTVVMHITPEPSIECYLYSNTKVISIFYLWDLVLNPAWHLKSHLLGIGTLLIHKQGTSDSNTIINVPLSIFSVYCMSYATKNEYLTPNGKC